MCDQAGLAEPLTCEGALAFVAWMRRRVRHDMDRVHGIRGSGVRWVLCGVYARAIIFSSGISSTKAPLIMVPYYARNMEHIRRD